MIRSPSLIPSYPLSFDPVRILNLFPGVFYFCTNALLEVFATLRFQMRERIIIRALIRNLSPSVSSSFFSVQAPPPLLFPSVRTSLLVYHHFKRKYFFFPSLINFFSFFACHQRGKICFGLKQIIPNLYV